jgi:predicted dehydrogenase
MNSRAKGKNPIGLAIVGCGNVGRIRGAYASHYPGVEWIGLCDVNAKVGKKLADDIKADFFTNDYRELLKRPEVNATIVATPENEHVDPTLAAVGQGHNLMLEKPLATDPVDSAKILKAIQEAGVDAVVGYTQRFRRKFLVVKEQILQGHLGQVTSAVTRAFMNRMAPITTLAKTENRSVLTPMVVSGTHSLDLMLWLLGEKKPVEVYARSVENALVGVGTKDATFGIFTFDDGSIWSMNISWALPQVWPAATYTLEIGVVGTKGVITIDDTHRDIVLASEDPHPTYRVRHNETKNVSFLASYPPGDVVMGQVWGAMREETSAWLSRIYTGLETPHATAAEGHRNLLLTMAMDLSAKRGKAVPLPIEPEELKR